MFVEHQDIPDGLPETGFVRLAEKSERMTMVVNGMVLLTSPVCEPVTGAAAVTVAVTTVP